jgi:hypothetical protein
MKAMASHPASDTGRIDARRRALRALCLGVPVAVLAASYLWLAYDHGTLLLWNVIVHETGRYTFGQTVLYFNHFLREVPTAIAYALFLLGISGAVPRRSDHGGERGRGVGGLALVLAGALVAGALLMSAASHGWDSAMQDLLQYRTRDDLAGYGTHWHYHWLSTLWFGAAVGVAPIVAHWITGAPVLRQRRFWTRAAWGYFLALTLVFGVSADVFLDVRYAGHQAREILTHGPVTLLLGLGVLLAAGVGRTLANAEHTSLRRPLAMALAALTLLVPAYLAVVSLGGDVMAEGQSDFGLGAMVGAHYFEHALDYLLVLLILGGGLALTTVDDDTLATSRPRA